MNERIDEGSRILAATSWSAIVAGVAVGLALQVLLLTFGLAFGMSVGDGLPEAGYAWWAFLVTLLTFAVAGAIAARISMTRTKLAGLVVGAMTWAAATAIGGILGNSMANPTMSRLGTTGMWSVFFGLLLGLGAAMIGGFVGATRGRVTLPSVPAPPRAPLETPAHSAMR